MGQRAPENVRKLSWRQLGPQSENSLPMVSTTGLGWIGVRSQALVRCGDARATSALSWRRPGGRSSPASSAADPEAWEDPVAGSLPDPLKAVPWAELRADQVISGRGLAGREREKGRS